MHKYKTRLSRLINKLRKFIVALFTKGPKYTWNIVRAKLKGISDNSSLLYQELIISKEDAKLQREIVFPYQPLISILVPVFNTDKKFFMEMVDSVIHQTYDNFELILVDASDDKQLYRKEYITLLKEPRIKYFKISSNGGIVANSNLAYEKATGEYIGLLDHDDVLAMDCLFEIVRAINEEKAEFIYTDEITFKHKLIHGYQPNLKPDFSPDTLRSYNYICHFSCFSRSLLKENEELFTAECEGSQDYDLILRLSERTRNICHVNKVLYFWRAHEQSTAQDISAKPYTMTAAKIALGNHLKRIGLNGIVEDASIPTTYKIKYEIVGNPKVSIIIPNKDHKEDLKKCIRSIFDKNTYSNIEIIIVENNSENKEIFDYYEELKQYHCIKIINYLGEFNYSAINNYAVSHSSGSYILLLNNDIEIITSSWIEEMLMFAQRDDVGCVGCKLLYSDNTVQHGGVIIGIGSVAGHAHKYYDRNAFGFMSRLQIAQNLSAVTAACLLIKKQDYQDSGGLDENFKVAFNDVDFCLRILAKGKLNVYTPFVEAYHYESKSRGLENNPKKVKRFQTEIKQFELRWGLYRKDIYYNKYLSLDKEDFSLK